MRLGNFVIAFLAVLALVAGGAYLHGLPYTLFSVAVIASAGGATFWLYALRSKRWVLEAYRLLGEGQLAEVRPLVEAELAKPQSGVKRQVLEQLYAEVSFWSGDFQAAYDQVRKIDLSKMPELWHTVVHQLIVTSALFTDRVAEARAELEKLDASLKTEPGHHHLQALVALREGNAAKAREHWSSVTHEVLQRPRAPIYRAALALLQAELALAHAEKADAQLGDAIALGGESWVTARARALTSSR